MISRNDYHALRRTEVVAPRGCIQAADGHGSTALCCGVHFSLTYQMSHRLGEGGEESCVGLCRGGRRCGSVIEKPGELQTYQRGAASLGVRNAHLRSVCTDLK